MKSFFSRIRRGLTFALGLTLVLGLQACGDDDPVTPDDPAITGLAANTPELSTLVTALTEAGLLGALEADGPFTVFAPVNSAFDALGSGTVDNLLDPANSDALTDLLTYHVVPGEFEAADLSEGLQLTTLAGGVITIGTTGGVTADGANVITADVPASNGVVHLIDGVLTRGLDAVQRATVTPDLSTLAAAVDAAGLVATLQGDGPFTIFAPVNSGFENVSLDALLDPANEALLTKILTNHVIAGAEVAAGDLVDGQTVQTVEGSTLEIDLDGGPTVNGIDIVTTDIRVGNGIVHLIDDVIVDHLNVVERAIATPDLSTLTAAVVAADLTTALQADGPFTVFAPVDAAFEALGEGTLDNLLDPANVGALTSLLTYHVVPGEFGSSDLSDGQLLTSLEGGEIAVGTSGGVTVDGQSVIVADIPVANGVVHLVDGVLTEGLDAVERATVTPDLATLAAAVGAADLVTTLQGDGPFTIFAPVNAGFDALELDALLDPANQGLLQKILTNHVIAGVEVAEADLVDGQMVGTVEGSMLEIDLDGGATVNGIDIIATDIRVGNGIVHLIDEVIVDHLNIVERAIATPQTQTLVDAVVAGDLAGTLSGAGPFTVFAPTNEAFAALPSDVLGRLLDPANQAILQKLLTYHVIPAAVREADLVDDTDVGTVEGTTVRIDLDGGATVNGANIVATDVETENGVIHLIDEVLIGSLDIVDQAVLYGFDTLVGAVQSAGLESTLRGDNMGAGFTVFAPTNDAFAAIAPLPTDAGVLSNILTYHVLPLTAESSGLSDGQVVATVQGGDVTIRIAGDGTISIEGATNTVTVTVVDVPAKNGVIHVIDAVLLP
jgi:transforming growth factor-beta-induced protein